MPSKSDLRVRFVLSEAEQLLTAMREHEHWPEFLAKHNGWETRFLAAQRELAELRAALDHATETAGARDIQELISDSLSEETKLVQQADDLRFRLALGLSQVIAFPELPSWSRPDSSQSG